jgi:hypothetical protein
MTTFDLKSCELSYCDNCGMAKPVGVFKLKDWHHNVRLCQLCLEKMAIEVSFQFSTIEKVQNKIKQGESNEKVQD